MRIQRAWQLSFARGMRMRLVGQSAALNLLGCSRKFRPKKGQCPRPRRPAARRLAYDAAGAPGARNGARAMGAPGASPPKKGLRGLCGGRGGCRVQPQPPSSPTMAGRWIVGGWQPITGAAGPVPWVAPVPAPPKKGLRWRSGGHLPGFYFGSSTPPGAGPVPRWGARGVPFPPHSFTVPLRHCPAKTHMHAGFPY